MNLEETLNALKQAFSGKSAEAETFSKELSDAKALVVSLTESNKNAAAAFDALSNDKVALEAKVALLQGELNKAKEIAEAALAAQKNAESKIESAGKKAADIAASVGVDAVEVSPVGVETSSKQPEDIALEWVEMKKTDPKAAQDFYTKNRSAILAAAGLR
jgi:chromosome segregation ATPase